MANPGGKVTFAKGMVAHLRGVPTSPRGVIPNPGVGMVTISQGVVSTSYNKS